MDVSSPLHFHGPFVFSEPGKTIAGCDFAAYEGIYLWTLSNSSAVYIHYIGETTNFLKRHKDHLTQMLGLNYGLFSPMAVQEQNPQPVYGGAWRDRSPDPLSNTLTNWLNYRDQIVPYIESIRVYFAPTNFEPGVRKHIEGCIARNLREKHAEYSLFYPRDNRTGTKKQKLGVRLAVTCDAPIHGLDSSIGI